MGIFIILLSLCSTTIIVNLLRHVYLPWKRINIFVHCESSDLKKNFIWRYYYNEKLKSSDEIGKDQPKMKTGCTRQDIYFRQITEKNENALARTHGESSGIFRFTLFDSSCDPSKWKSLCVSMPTWGESLTARVDNVNAAGSYAKVEPHFPRILKHSPYTGRAWYITIAEIKLRLCISGVPERARTHYDMQYNMPKGSFYVLIT